MFLEKYTRNNYNSVTANFKIYTVSTPEGYDYTNYKNYMYYDNEDKKLYLPAGCTVQCYKCSANNGELYTPELFNEYVAERDDSLIGNNYFTDVIISSMVENGFFNIDNDYYKMLLEEGTISSYSDYLRITHQIDDNENVLSYLFPSNTYLKNLNSIDVLVSLADKVKYTGSIKGFSFSVAIQNICEFLGIGSGSYKYYSNLKHIIYYSYRGVSIQDITRFSDFAFATTSIYSYEDEKNSLNRSNNIYDIYRNTKIYTMNNKINDYTFRINYSDSQDVTSMLPEGTDTDYLTSPFYKGNENSSSGGNITYDIQEVIQGDKIIDYSKDDNSIHNDINNTYIENWNEGDNIVINTVDNPSIDKIYKTSQDILGILRLLYTSVLHIETKLGQFSDLMSNTTNNFTYNTTNQIEYLFVPNKAILKDDLQKMSDETDEHLGILAQGTDFLLFVGTLYYNIDDPEQIVLHIPKISIWEHTLIPETTFNFTNFMTNDLPFLGTMHNMYLTAVDLFFLWILIGFAEKIYNKFTGNGGE